jgi:hypothetical protein
MGATDCRNIDSGIEQKVAAPCNFEFGSSDLHTVSRLPQKFPPSKFDKASDLDTCSDLGVLREVPTEHMAAIEEVLLLDALAKQLENGQKRPELGGLACASKHMRDLVSLTLSPYSFVTKHSARFLWLEPLRYSTQKCKHYDSLYVV